MPFAAYKRLPDVKYPAVCRHRIKEPVKFLIFSASASHYILGYYGIT